MQLGSHFRTLLTVSTILVGTTFSAHATDDRRVVQTESGSIVTNDFGNCTRTRFMADGDPCAPAQPPAPVVVAAPVMHRVIAQEDRTVYFDFNQARLTPASTTKLNSLANVLKSESDVKDARIVGYADRIGSESYNQSLSRKRSEAVANYLISHGFVNASVAETRWLGESVPVTSCPATLSHAQLVTCLQKDRRVEVEIDYLSQDEAPGPR